jgi:hypothetical protein
MLLGGAPAPVPTASRVRIPQKDNGRGAAETSIGSLQRYPALKDPDTNMTGAVDGEDLYSVSLADWILGGAKDPGMAIRVTRGAALHISKPLCGSPAHR